MICHKCGTESREDFCPRCGEMLRSGAIPPSVPQTPATPAAPPTPAEPPAAAPIEQKAKREKRKKEKKGRSEGPKVPFGSIAGAAAALFLPLIYLFMDAFILLSDRLFAADGSPQPLVALMQKLQDPLYANNSLQELLEVSFGENIAVYRAITPLSFLRAGEELGALVLPLLLQLLLVIGSVACAALLFVSLGRLLRSRIFTTLTVLFGIGAAISPLLGNALLHLWYAFGHGVHGADVLMQRILLAPEAACLAVILLCVLLPSLQALRNAAARMRSECETLLFPFGFLAKLPFGAVKLIAGCSILLCIGFTVLLTFLPIGGELTIRHLGTVLSADWKGLFDLCMGLKEGNGSFAALAALLLDGTTLLWIPITFLSVLSMLVAAVRVFTIYPQTVWKKPRTARVLRDVGNRIRCGVLTAYSCFVLVQILLMLVSVFATSAMAHVALSNVPATLSLLYLTVGYVSALGGTGTLYLILAIWPLLLSLLADQSSRTLLLLGDANVD
ncbi:MAG: hypothetical protein E7590_06290 [Ruminococcaceae bacterium]|nr:hypothetical protein [Oscillospiraceae bacterium]